ncbi:MAG: hypothetical protein ACE5E5_10250 [Phycisphaerae bacterium]
MIRMRFSRRHFPASRALTILLTIGCFNPAAFAATAGPPDAKKKSSPAPTAGATAKEDRSASGTDAPTEAKPGSSKKVRVEDVLDGYVEATGGRDAYAKVKNRSSVGTYEVVGQGVVFDLTIIEGRPNYRYTYMIATTGRDPVESATDGTRAWAKIGRLPAKMKEGKGKALAIRAGYFDRIPDWRKMYTAARFGGVVTIDGKPCYKLVLTPTVGLPETHYYDIETKLLVQKEEQFENGGDIMTTKFSDYKEIDGILIAHQEHIDYAGHQRLKTLKKIEHNIDIPPDQYDPPPYPDPRYSK